MKLFLAAFLLAVAALYTRGAWVLLTRKDLVHGLQQWQAGAFAAGWFTAALTLLSPLERLAHHFLSAHLAQYALLTLVAAPLIVFGRPLVPLLWAFPIDVRKTLVAKTRSRSVVRAWRFVTHPVVILLAHAVALWAWHVPVFAEAALKDEGTHLLQHATFFFSAVLFFQAIAHGRAARMGYGVAAAYVFAAALHTSLLGALLTFSPRVWYRSYVGQGANDPLLDQHFAGLLLWITAGVALTSVGFALILAGREAASRNVKPANVERLVPRSRPFTRTQP